jgi:16S rRNA G527 N7-methylase RsmG
MIDSVNKKVIFINSTLEKLGLSPSAFHARIEECNRYPAFSSNKGLDSSLYITDILTARALKSLKEILSLINKSIRVEKKILLLKGAKIFEEIEEAKNTWDLEYNLYPSITSDNSFILEITKYTIKT